MDEVMEILDSSISVMLCAFRDFLSSSRTRAALGVDSGASHG